MQTQKAPRDSVRHCWKFGWQYLCMWFIVVLVVAGSVLFAPSQATAEIMVVVGSAEVLPGQSSFLDVSFEVVDETYSLAAYMIELNLSGPDSRVRFTGFGEADNAIFPGQVALQTTSRPALPGATAAANDILLTGENPITDGAGLIRLLFETDADSLGIYDVTVDTTAELTNFSDGLWTLIPIDQFVPGAITVVPEPSSFHLLWAIGALGIAILMRRVTARAVT